MPAMTNSELMALSPPDFCLDHCKIQWLDNLRGQVTQGVVHTLQVGFHRHFPVVTFCEDIRQPNHRCPPPTEPPLCPMARDMPVQDRRQAHLDHLPDE